MYRRKLIEKIQVKVTRAETVKAAKEHARLFYDTMVRSTTKSGGKFNMSANKLAASES